MKNNIKSVLVWIVLAVLFMNGGFLESLFNSGSTAIEYDSNMQTTGFHTAVNIGEDGSYSVDERIEVSFLTSRHGIYRYIPYKGSIVTGNQKIVKTPYIADVEFSDASTTVTKERENGNQVFRLGDENTTVSGPQTYTLSYRYTPKVQEEDFQLAYYNLFPAQWQNKIPAGSTFSITFPKDTDLEEMVFYYGKYGENRDASEVLSIQTDKTTNTITGTLLETLEFKEGLTCYQQLPSGYFTDSNQISGIGPIILIPALIIFGIILLLFFLYGRDEKIIPSIQYQPPNDFDSAAVGYIIDGKVQDKDVLSLIIYWADKGYLRIEEEEKDHLKLYKLQDLPSNAPLYQHTVFHELFRDCAMIHVDNLQYKFDGTIAAAKSQIKHYFTDKEKNNIYTKSSIRARGVSVLLSTLPFGWFMLITSIYSYTSIGRTILQVILWLALLGGMLYFKSTIDNWYSKDRKHRKSSVIGAIAVCLLSEIAFAGSYIVRVLQGETFNYIWVMLLIIAMTVVMVVVTGFMKKRTKDCVEWMGRLAGLRDFIETAELERMKVIAQESPQLFYHIMPYAYVFGLSDVFAEKLKGLALAPPEWYSTHRSFTFFDYYIFNRCLMGNMSHMTQTLTVPEPPKTSGGSSGGFSGGGFGGGGFSGGGFGGGGGGSW